MKTLIAENVFADAAGAICEVIKSKPDAVIAFDMTRDIPPLYEALLEAGTDLSKITFIQAVELEGGRAIREFNENEFVVPSGIASDGFLAVDGDNYQQFDGLIEQLGGIDLFVTGLGVKGQVCFNEPAVPYDSVTHLQRLTNSTKEEISFLLQDGENCPDRGYTAGIKTIVSARKIIIVAAGESKAKAVYQTLYARDDSVVPSAFLQLPADVVLYTDSAAAGEIA